MQSVQSARTFFYRVAESDLHASQNLLAPRMRAPELKAVDSVVGSLPGNLVVSAKDLPGVFNEFGLG